MVDKLGRTSTFGKGSKQYIESNKEETILDGIEVEAE